MLKPNYIEGRVSPNTKEKAAGSLVDKWEGPYQMVELAGNRAYHIIRSEEGELPRPCNA
ncbi:hypothetical protein Dsin_009333 [Dipteronia sinensis]|uniref:Uncharacterized protein n=1 Tax=Dipteronia sinensis TaxID=43782 RepID=A0AAE0EBJ0_9ROSI|nr:hypothetical protein Dsin_009333 [Dipteronia sinensis]